MDQGTDQQLMLFWLLIIVLYLYWSLILLVRLFSCGTSKEGESHLVEWNESEGAIKRTYSGFRKRSLGVVQFDTTRNRFLAAGDEFMIKFWDMDNTNILTTTDADGGLPVSSHPKLCSSWVICISINYNLFFSTWKCRQAQGWDSTGKDHYLPSQQAIMVSRFLQMLMAKDCYVCLKAVHLRGHVGRLHSKLIPRWKKRNNLLFEKGWDKYFKRSKFFFV